MGHPERSMPSAEPEYKNWQEGKEGRYIGLIEQLQMVHGEWQAMEEGLRLSYEDEKAKKVVNMKHLGVFKRLHSQVIQAFERRGPEIRQLILHLSRMHDTNANPEDERFNRVSVEAMRYVTDLVRVQGVVISNYQEIFRSRHEV